MSEINDQKELRELLVETSEVIKNYVNDGRSVSHVAKVSGVSKPTIQGIIDLTVKNVTLSLVIQILNSIGYKLDGLKISKIK